MLLNELKAKLASINDEMRELHSAKAADWKDEDQAKFDALEKEYDGVRAQVTRGEKIEANGNMLGASAGRQIPAVAPEIGMNDSETGHYSMVKAILAQATGDWSKAGLELEASQAVAKAQGKNPRGFYVPNDVLRAPIKNINTVGTPGDGGFTVATDLLSASFIELLCNKLVLKQAGMTVMSGLVGNVAIPKQLTGAVAHWVDEGTAITAITVPTFGQATMTPHSLGSYLEMSRLLLQQSSIGVEGFVRNDLARSLALEIDRAGLHGTAASNIPEGIITVTGIGNVVGGADGAAPTWANIIALETEVAQDNADIGNLAYITNAKVRGKLKSTLRTATYGDIPVWGDGATPLNGYPAYVTNQVSCTLTKGNQSLSSAIFFGNWAELIMGMWGQLDVLVNPYANDTTGAVRVRAFQEVDFCVRHAQSFAAMKDALTA
jgi:HK97 family phage major capsid protein